MTALISKMNTIVINKNTRVPYRYNGEVNFTNLVTGVSGTVSEEAARKTFNISAECTILFNDYPVLVDLVSKLKLGIEKL